MAVPHLRKKAVGPAWPGRLPWNRMNHGAAARNRHHEPRNTETLRPFPCLVGAPFTQFCGGPDGGEAGNAEAGDALERKGSPAFGMHSRTGIGSCSYRPFRLPTSPTSKTSKRSLSHLFSL